MKKLDFAALPLIVQATSVMTLFMAWIMIEEWIIDRHGLGRFLPLYRVGNLCLYDFTVAAILGFFWFRARRSENP